MNDEPVTYAETRRPGLSWLLWLVFTVFVVYPLSTGPAVHLDDKGILPREFFEIYEPLGYFVKNSDAADRFFKWYLQDLWRWSPPFK